MKAFKLLFIAAMVLILNSCDELDKYTKFDLNFTQEVTIKASTSVNLPLNLPTPPVATNSESAFKTKNTNKNLVEEINLTKLQLKVTSPAGEDFSILKSIEVFIMADGMTTEKIAWLDAVPENQSTIILNVSGADLKDFIFADEFSLNVKTVTDEANTRDYKIEIASTFNVNAKLLGI